MTSAVIGLQVMKDQQLTTIFGFISLKDFITRASRGPLSFYNHYYQCCFLEEIQIFETASKVETAIKGPNQQFQEQDCFACKIGSINVYFAQVQTSERLFSFLHSSSTKMFTILIITVSYFFVQTIFGQVRRHKWSFQFAANNLSMDIDISKSMAQATIVFNNPLLPYLLLNGLYPIVPCAPWYLYHRILFTYITQKKMKNKKQARYGPFLKWTRTYTYYTLK